MIRFEAALFVLVVERLKTMAETVKEANLADSPDEGKELVNRLLEDITKHISILPSASDFDLKIFMLRHRLNETAMNTQELGILLEALHQDICADLLKLAFLLIPERKVELLDQIKPPFGKDVAKVFPGAKSDIAAASRCLALDEWTASVFHSMRVLEHALRRFAAELNLSATYEENWHNIIDKVESTIKKAQNAPRSPTKAETLKLYSNAAVNFRYFKDAWRNHVSHSKETYGELEATTIYNHVRDFLQVLASNLGQTP